MVVIYGIGAVLAISEVITGRMPVQALLGLPISLLLVWFFYGQPCVSKFLRVVANP
jgi:hypothetical protein